MQITGSSNPKVAFSGSVLRAANEQPQLAADLISKAIESMTQTQRVQLPAQPVTASGNIETGTIVNITA
ncbi:MAG: hypothetical protein JZU63_01500 [Rhodoferax sp.]|nr:hypothetical protein [Rhodoferax sp.]